MELNPSLGLEWSDMGDLTLEEPLKTQTTKSRYYGTHRMEKNEGNGYELLRGRTASP